jgi:hypothetical protein
VSEKNVRDHKRTQLEAALMVDETCESMLEPAQPVLQYTAGQLRVRVREPLPHVTDHGDQADQPVHEVPCAAAR